MFLFERMKKSKILIWSISIFVIGIFNFSEAEEHVSVGRYYGECKELRPLFLDRFGELQRKIITLRKLENDGEVKYQAVSKKGGVTVILLFHFNSSVEEQLIKLFKEREEAELLCLFYETFWVDDDSVPGLGAGTTKDDQQYAIPGMGWNCGQNIVLYEAKSPK